MANSNPTHEERIFDVLERTNLNWSVQLQPLHLPNGTSTDFNAVVGGPEGDQVFTAVGQVYQTYQNHEMVDTMIRATEGILPSEDIHGGPLRDGRLVFLQGALPEERIGKSGIKRNITMGNSHDGTSSIGFGTTNQVIVCANTFHHALKSIQRIRHTFTAQERIDAAVANFRVAMEQEERMMELFTQAADRTANERSIREMVKAVFNVDMTTQQADLPVRTRKTMTDFSEAVVQSFTEQGDTVWGLFNAVTRYTNHVIRSKDDGQLFKGRGYELNAKALKALPEIVNNAPSTTWV